MKTTYGNINQNWFVQMANAIFEMSLTKGSPYEEKQIAWVQTLSKLPFSPCIFGHLKGTIWGPFRSQVYMFIYFQ